MAGFDAAVWYAVKAEGAYPALRLRGTTIGDVNEDGAFELSTDAAALRVNIITASSEISNGDFNRDGSVNIFDLVALSK